MKDFQNEKKMDIIEEIINILEEGKKDIQTNLEVKKINASGRTSESITVQRTETGARLVSLKDAGAAPLAVTETGRPGGKVPYGFVEIIEEWLKDKGLSSGDDKTDRKRAGAIAFGKIKPRGYGRPSPSDYGSQSPDVYTPVVEETVNKIEKTVINYVVQTIKLN